MTAATETSQLDAWACGGDCSGRWTPMASATMSTTAWVVPTSAASATVLAPSTSADVLTSQKDCDCDGNQLDALGVCGGDCAADADADGICDDVDDCVGVRRVRHLQRSWRHLRVRMF